MPVPSFRYHYPFPPSLIPNQNSTQKFFSPPQPLVLSFISIQKFIPNAPAQPNSNFILRVGTDGTLTPRAAVLQACRELVNDLATLNQEFTKEYELRKMVGADAKAESSGPHRTDDGGADSANGTTHHRRG